MEFALLSTILVPTLLYAIFFAEASRAKLKTTEAARYLVWETTVLGLSNWENADHAGRFNALKGQVASEVAARWGDDLEGASPTFTAGQRATTGVTIRTRFDPSQVQLRSVDAGAYDVNVAGADLGVIGQTFDRVLNHFKFNTQGKIQGSFTMGIENIFLRKTMAIGYRENMLVENRLNLKSAQSLIADQWDIKQGQSVNELESINCNSHYCKQLKRMTFLGLAQAIPQEVTNGLGANLSYINVHFPLNAVLVSNAMMGAGRNPAPDVSFDIRVPDHTPVTLDYSNATTDRRSGQERNSTYFKVYRRLGRNYLGCKDLEKQEGQCRYR